MITPAAFTLDVYGHVTEEMKRASADRIEKFIQGVSGTQMRIREKIRETVWKTGMKKA